jgi:hypothetical protein
VRTIGYIVELLRVSALSFSYNYNAFLIILVLSILSTWLNHFAHSPCNSINKYSNFISLAFIIPPVFVKLKRNVCACFETDNKNRKMWIYSIH